MSKLRPILVRHWNYHSPKLSGAEDRTVSHRNAMTEAGERSIAETEPYRSPTELPHSDHEQLAQAIAKRKSPLYWIALAAVIGIGGFAGFAAMSAVMFFGGFRGRPPNFDAQTEAVGGVQTPPPMAEINGKEGVQFDNGTLVDDGKDDTDTDFAF